MHEKAYFYGDFAVNYITLCSAQNKQHLLYCDFYMYESFNFGNTLKMHNTSSLELTDSKNQVYDMCLGKLYVMGKL